VPIKRWSVNEQDQICAVSVVAYAGLVAVAIMLLVEVCVILQHGMISRRAHRQELIGGTLSTSGSLDTSVQ
jgi:hypothetical protein